MSDTIIFVAVMVMAVMLLTHAIADCAISDQCDRACAPYVVNSYGNTGCLCADVDGGETFKRRHP